MKSKHLQAQHNILYLPTDVNMVGFSCPEAKIFIQLIANISARIINVPAENLDQEILLSLTEIFNCLEADRGGLLKVEERPLTAKVTHAWYGENIPQIPEDLNVVDHYPWAFQKIIVENRILALTTANAFPEEAEIDRASYATFRNKSSLVIPLKVGDRCTYAFAVDLMKHECSWPIEIINNLKLIGEIFVNALQRRETDLTLFQTRNRLDLAAASADAALWELDFTTNDLWVNDKARQMFDYASDDHVTLDNFMAKVHVDDRPMILAALDSLSQEHREIKAEYRTDEAQPRWMYSRGRLTGPVGNGRGRLTGVTLDISQRKRMELALQQQLVEIEQLRARLEEENTYLRNECINIQERQRISSVSDTMQTIKDQIDQVARTGSIVLIQGETGTGKEVIAQQIHQLSDRRKRVMIKVNCAALPAALVESELFGREKGAFTGALSKQSGRFELAHGSTLFLDEIAEMPLDTQAKLLRVLQEGEFERLGSPQTIRVDVRVIAASNRDLKEEVRCGRFREDLFYRLNVFPLHVPPLRERIDDIPNLVWEFVNEFGERMGKKIRRISKRDMELLKAQNWPGNIRELRNVIEHALIVTQGDALELQHFSNTESSQHQVTTLEDVERQHIQKILTTTNGRIKGTDGAADRLGLNPSTLYSRMRKLGIHTKLS